VTDTTITIIYTARDASFFFRRVAVLVQRFNAVLLRDTLLAADWMD